MLLDQNLPPASLKRAHGTGAVLVDFFMMFDQDVEFCTQITRNNVLFKFWFLTNSISSTNSIAIVTMKTAVSTKSLRVYEKFRAAAALYTPSANKGDGWCEVSRPGMGGEVIIQLQDHATLSETFVTVVRFQHRHGKDVVNARIVKGLPINRINQSTVVFKSSSSNTNGYRKKTIFRVTFENSIDTDEFLMWWYEKNGSIKTWLKEGSNQKGFTAVNKRKNRDPTNCGFTPKKKKPKSSALPCCKEEGRSSSKKKKTLLVESTNFDSIEKKRKHPSVVTSKLKNSSSNEGVDLEDVGIDSEYAPQSQNWMSAFDQELNN